MSEIWHARHGDGDWGSALRARTLLFPRSWVGASTPSAISRPPRSTCDAEGRNGTMNRIEDFKREKDGLDVLPEIERYSREGPDSISERDKALMKSYGVFFRKHTPGFVMLRIRITNAIATGQPA